MKFLNLQTPLVPSAVLGGAGLHHGSRGFHTLRSVEDKENSAPAQHRARRQRAITGSFTKRRPPPLNLPSSMSSFGSPQQTAATVAKATHVANQHQHQQQQQQHNQQHNQQQRAWTASAPAVTVPTLPAGPRQVSMKPVYSSGTRSSDPVVVEGRRGAGVLEPENTLRSFKRAVEIGCAAAACDVWRTRDGKLAVIAAAPGNTSPELVDFSDLRKLDAGCGERVPLLEELLQSCGHQLHLNLLIKSRGAEMARRVVAAVRAFNASKHVSISSIDRETLEFVKAFAPEIDVEWVLNVHDSATPSNFTQFGDAINLLATHASKSVVTKAHSAGQRVVVRFQSATQETDDEFLRLISIGVDRICCAEPDRLIQVLARRSQMIQVKNRLLMLTIDEVCANHREKPFPREAPLCVQSQGSFESASTDDSERASPQFKSGKPEPVKHTFSW